MPAPQRGCATPRCLVGCGPLIEGGVVATTASLDAEALYRTRGPAEYEQLCADRRAL